nr:MerR family transcriptional regulator [uncultured Gellertiella sp.]
MQDTRFKIAEAARMAGVSSSTLRLWETQGLIEPIRTASGQRLFDAGLIERLKRITWLRHEQGLNPAAIRERLKLEAEEPQAVPTLPSVDPLAQSASDQIPVGQKVRRLRRAAGKTLETIAREAGVAMSVLSTFERTSQGLSLPALHAVARIFGTTVAALCGQDQGRPGESLVRAGQWATWPRTSSGVSVQVLADSSKQMECHRFHLAPGATSEGAYQHEGEEFIHVLQGSLEIVLDGDQFFELNAGDSFYFESHRPHSWRNMAEGDTLLIWVNTPATF